MIDVKGKISDRFEEPINLIVVRDFICDRCRRSYIYSL